jgi:hypothetical protein
MARLDTADTPPRYWRGSDRKAGLILVDRDANAIKRLADRFGDQAEIIHATFWKRPRGCTRTGRWWT